MAYNLSREPINYSAKNINRKDIPEDIYVCEFTENKDWKYIIQYKFDNGLNYIIGANTFTNSINDILKSLKMEYETIIDMESPEELQVYYFDEFDIFYRYRIIEKIFNYYIINRDKIEDILLSYRLL